MIVDALRKLNEKSGSSRQAIVKYIIANHKLDAKLVNQHVKLALKNGVKNGALKQSKVIFNIKNLKLQ
jgi:histone H1/5